MLSPTGKNVMDLLRLRESESDSKGQECRRHRQPAARLPRRDRRSAHNSDRRPSSGNPKTWQKKFVHPDGSCFALLCSALLFFALLCSCRIGQSANRPVGQSAGAIFGSVDAYCMGGDLLSDIRSESLAKRSIEVSGYLASGLEFSRPLAK